MGRYFAELIDQAVAMILTLTMVMTFLWPFMSDGFWSEKLSYLWLATLAGVFWVFLPIIIAIARATYKDWRLYRAKS